MVKKFFKLFAINILILICILLILNFISIIIYQGHKVFENISSRNFNSEFIDYRANLPNYDSINWASKHFKEFSELKSEYKSYIGWRRLAYSGETININGDGIRTTPQSELTTEESLLAVFLGGSTLWGTGSDDKNTIPAIFSKITAGKYRTLNLGESGYREFQSYLMLLQEINKGLKPDVVISYAGANEIYGFKSELNALSNSREYQIRTIMKGQDTRGNLDDLNLTFGNFFIGPLKSFITKLKIRASLNKGQDYYGYDLSNERTEQVAKALLDSWIEEKQLAEKNGAIFIAALQPNIAVGNPYTEYLKINKEFIKPFELLYPVILRKLQEPGYKDIQNSFIDLSDVFNVKDYIYIDYCHVSPNGNYIIAEKLMNFLRNKTDK